MALFLVLLSGTPCTAATQTDFRFLPAFFSGDFGSDVQTEISYVPVVFTVQSRRNELRVTLPFLSIRSDQTVSFVGGQVIPEGGSPQTESGPGDAILQDDYYVMEGNSRVPWMFAGLRIKLPTGDETRGLGTGQTDIGPGAGIIQPLGSRWNLMGEVRYVFMGDPPGIDYQNSLWVDLGTQVRTSKLSWLGFFYDRRTSVLHDLPPIEDVASQFDVQISPTVKLRSALFKGLSDTAEDYGVSVGFSILLLSPSRSASQAWAPQ